jgi:hypothetical protein
MKMCPFVTSFMSSEAKFSLQHFFSNTSISQTGLLLPLTVIEYGAVVYCWDHGVRFWSIIAITIPLRVAARYLTADYLSPLSGMLLYLQTPLLVNTLGSLGMSVCDIRGSVSSESTERCGVRSQYRVGRWRLQILVWRSSILTDIYHYCSEFRRMNSRIVTGLLAAGG